MFIQAGGGPKTSVDPKTNGETLPAVIIKHLQRTGVFGWQQGA